MRKLVLYVITCMFMLGIYTNSFAKDNKANIGFAFGSSFHLHQKSNFDMGTGTFFRLLFTGNDDSTFFVHSEESSYSITSGDAVANGRENVHGIGAMSSLGDGLTLELMVGGATINHAAATGTGAEAVSATRSTDPIADIGFHWVKTSGRVNINVGLAYRAHKLGQNITVTDSNGKSDTVNDKSSFIIGLSVGYSF